MANVNMGTLYDMNKSMLANLPTLSRNQIKGLVNEKIGEYIKDTDNTYYMLLCNETRDYTVFKLNELENLPNMLKEMQLCLQERGEVISIDKHKHGGIEIWIKGTGYMPLLEKDNFFCYFLFPYDNAILEF